MTFKFLTNATPVVQTLFGNKSLATLDNLECNVCGSKTNVEMHHVRQLKDLNPKLDMMDKLMASRKRKQIPLCRICHVDKHTRAKRRIGGSQQQTRGYHHRSLKRKGKSIVIFKEQKFALILYPRIIKDYKRLSLFKTVILMGIIFILIIISSILIEPEK